MGFLVRLVAIVSSVLILLGFAYFATDEMSRGSQNQQNALNSELSGSEESPPVAPSPEQEADRERLNGPFREAVEDTNDVLLGPFAGLVESAETRWVGHGVPALLGLLLYGFCLGVLARMLPKHRDHVGDWRAAEGS
jgi:hypothetical protein